MEHDFSIELAHERIIDARTRRYFEEVHRSYVAGGFRSAVVMLWSVVVCDLLFKLDQLSSAFGDATAKRILGEIESLRIKSPRSPDWEAALVEAVAKHTCLLDAAELSNLRNLQE